MAIPASHIVQVLPRVIDAGSADLELNGLLLSDNPTISASSLVVSFPSARAVGEYFGIDSVEYAAASVYFTGYNNKQAAPRALRIARRVATAASGWLRGGKVTQSVNQLKAVTNGSLSITIDATAITLSGVSFAAATSYSAIAAALQTALAAKLAGVKVAYSSLFGAFTITSPTSGAASTVSYGAATGSGTDLAAALLLTEALGAVQSAGMAGMDENAQMTAIINKSQNWVCFTTAWEAAPTEASAWAAWADANYGYLYVGFTTAATALNAGSAADTASVIKAAGYDHAAVIYGTVEHAAFIMGIVASIAWRRLNGTITTAFKAQSGLAPTVYDEGTAAALEGKNCNYFGNFATRNAEFIFLYPGCLSASEYGFIDPYVNSIWLNNRLQVALMDGLTLVGRVPYNVRGYTMIKAWMMDPVNEARNNGAIEPGITLSERQKTEVINEAGLDITGELWTQGYYIQVLDPGAAVRAQRGSPVVSLWYTYGGAVQKIDVSSVAIL